MTSDGISDADWDRVHELAGELVDACEREEEDVEVSARQKLLAFLDHLDQVYGPKASLLATRADFVESSDDREALLQSAYSEADRLNDTTNKILVAQSLAEFYLEGVLDHEKGATWLATWRFQLGRTATEYDREELKRLEQLVRARQHNSA
jgi:hypothetical protein